jgi:hypothetical protein
MSQKLNPEKALIFRITHIDNLQWILENGLHCASSVNKDPNFISIGNPELINRRANRELPPPYGGRLGDYVPFYFTPYSPMMLNIKTGYNGITKRANADIVVLASSFHNLQGRGTRVVFSDRHAYLQAANFSDDPNELSRIDWPLLQNRDFKRDPEDPEKVERYQAEALAFQHVPVDALLGIACYSDSAKTKAERYAAAAGATVRVLSQPSWYF